MKNLVAIQQLITADKVTTHNDWQAYAMTLDDEQQKQMTSKRMAQCFEQLLQIHHTAQDLDNADSTIAALAEFNAIQALVNSEKQQTLSAKLQKVAERHQSNN